MSRRQRTVGYVVVRAEPGEQLRVPEGERGVYDDFEHAKSSAESYTADEGCEHKACRLVEGAAPRRAGRVESATRRELRELGEPYRTGVLAELALVLAKQVDRGGDGPSTTAKLVSELRVTLGQLREVARDGGSGASDGGEFSTPDWDAEDAGAPDVGGEGGGGGAPAG